ncbi:MAG: Peptidase [Segetibacter sp.]|nr:Peptidase [Segetibacter sp.]
MNRKTFLQILVPATLGTLFVKEVFAGSKSIAPIASLADESLYVIPPYLQAGDTIAITCPAGAVDYSSMLPCEIALKKWGLNVRYGSTVGKKWQRFGGTDKERLDDFQAMIDDPSIKAIMFGKGGYGTMRIIDKLNWDKFKQNPKWLVGYSDLTVVHSHVHANLGIATIHGDMGTGFIADPYDASAFSLQQALFGGKMEYNIKSFSMNRLGTAKGKVVGGNLSMLHACTGSKSDIKTDGKILFIEDVSEFKYSIDRMMMSLKRSGKLENLTGLIVGEFTATKQDAEDSFDMRIEDIIWDKVKEYNYPVCFHFPSGHIRENRALKLGLNYTMNVGREYVLLEEDGLPIQPIRNIDLKIEKDTSVATNLPATDSL